MSSSRPVVVGVPASVDLTAALSWAAEHAGRTGAELRLVRAFDVGPVAPDPDDLRRAEQQASDLLRQAEVRAREIAGPDAVVSAQLVRGPVVGSLVEASEDAELVVLQRRDRSPVERLLTRSISCGVAARAQVSVAVVPERPAAVHHGVVTVGIDVPERSGVLLRRALDEAAGRASTLRVVHALWHVGGMGEYLVEQATATRHLARARADLEDAVAAAQRGRPEVAVVLDVRRVEPADALVEHSAGSDLLLVDRHDPVLGPGFHLGPVAAAVVRESRCPVLVAAPTRRHRRPEVGQQPNEQRRNEQRRNEQGGTS